MFVPKKPGVAQAFIISSRLRVTRAVAYFLGSLLGILFTKLFASECTRLKEKPLGTACSR